MNSQRMAEIADYIEKNPDHYDQDHWGWRMPALFAYLKDKENIPNPCGAVACVAGWACVLYSDEDLTMSSQHNSAQGLLELTDDEADCLFNSSWPVEWAEDLYIEVDIEDYNDYTSRFDPSASQAVTILRHFAELGYVPCE